MNRPFTRASKIFLFTAIVLSQTIVASQKIFAQVGCTDPQATNYNAAAISNDGSCVYASTTITLTDKTALSTPLLDETSGVVFTNGSVWTHNDSGNSHDIYRIDSLTNTILQSVNISNATNVDWEDITADSNYIYVGDIGNNDGNRQNLKIYRISKTALTPSTVSIVADVINFSFSDQTTFTSLHNNNNFDCESMIFYNDSLHLFSKDWVDKQTRHYVLPATPGTYIAQVKETLNAGFLVTGAGIQKNGVIALVGYDNTGVAPIYVYMLYDFKNGLFFNGNKRRFNSGSAISYGQTEGIDFRNGAYGYISNERFQQSVFNVAPHLRSFNLTPYLPASLFAPVPITGFIQSKDSICVGGAIQFTDTSKNIPTSWLWNFTGGTPSTSTLQNPIVTYNTSGIYDVTLTATNASGNNSKTKTGAVVINALPIATVTPNGSTQFCVGGSVVLAASTGVGYHYQWKSGTANIKNASLPNYTAKATGSYSVLISDANQCSKQSAAVAVTGPPATGISILGSLNVCNNDSVRLRVTAGVGCSYQWQKNSVDISGATNQTYYGKSAGVYRVGVTDSYGCSKYSATKTITNNCLLPAERMADANVPFTVYPNPFTDSFNIEMNETSEAQFAVLDITGKEVITTQQILANETLSIGSQLKPGIYFLRFVTDEKSWVTRLIKTK